MQKHHVYLSKYAYTHGYAYDDLLREIARGWADGYVGQVDFTEPTIDSRYPPPLASDLPRWGLIPLRVYAAYYGVALEMLTEMVADRAETRTIRARFADDQWYIDPHEALPGCGVDNRLPPPRHRPFRPLIPPRVLSLADADKGRSHARNG